MDRTVQIRGVQFRSVFGGVEPLDGAVAPVQSRLNEIEIACSLADEMAIRAERRAEFHSPESRRRPKNICHELADSAVTDALPNGVYGSIINTSS